jgi:nucleoid DNA-binding protein
MSKEKLHTADIAGQLAASLSLNKRVTEDFMKTLIATIEENLLAKDTVKLKGFGTFKLQWNDPRKSVDVNTGDEIIIEGYYKAVFTPDADFKELVNEPYAHLDPILLDDNVEMSKDNKTEDQSVDEATVPLKLFNEQATEIKDILSEINALNGNKEENKKEEEAVVLSEQTIVSDNTTMLKTKKKGLSVLLMFVVGVIIGGALFYMLSYYDLLPELSVKVDINLPDEPVVETPDAVVMSLSDSAQVDTEDVIVMPPVDSLQLLFDEQRVYTEFIATEKVKSGSRLTVISLRHYGVKEFWVYIFEANRDKFSSPDQIVPGTILKIPALNPVLADKDNPRCMDYALKLHDLYLKK